MDSQEGERLLQTFSVWRLASFLSCLRFLVLISQGVGIG